MGEKQTWKRKHFLFYCTSLLAIFLMGIACTTTSNLKKRWNGQEHLENAEKYMIMGNYKEALKEDEEALGFFPNIPPGDSALYHMGLIWAHPDNPQRDYERSLECFQQVIKGFPQSTLKENARILIRNILDLRRRNKEIENLRKLIDSLKIGIEKHNKIIKNQKRIINSQNEIINSQNEVITIRNDSITNLKEQLKKLKQVDIITEKKRRQRLSKE